ncbi:MAG: 4-hydroxy-tetrahydrodipicolinate synthase [Clostridiales bacterium]|nr:4-hydroxy-tetrahydrodipicolinate synthase [Clostridiales bacterium]
MKKTIFQGAATAIITPFKNGEVDYESFGKMIDWQIDSGIDGLVVCGTTGEASTLNDEEHRNVIGFAVQKANKRVPIIAGTGSNDTVYAIDLTKEACSLGADAVLCVTPYYNKATQKGLIDMYIKIADASEKPVILYNVPSRTCVNIEPSTYAVLADHENIVAIKEANGNISKIVETMSLVGDKLDLYSGNDDQILPLLALGGKGVISVVSNIMPKETKEICTSFFSGDIKSSCRLQLQMHNFIDSLFSEVNPIPVKAAAAAMGLCLNELRLPLTTMDETKYQKMLGYMRELGLNV